MKKIILLLSLAYSPKNNYREDQSTVFQSFTVSVAY